MPLLYTTPRSASSACRGFASGRRVRSRAFGCGRRIPRRGFGFGRRVRRPGGPRGRRISSGTLTHAGRLPRRNPTPVRRTPRPGPVAVVFLHAYPDNAKNPVHDSELRRTIRYRQAQHDLHRFLQRRRASLRGTISSPYPSTAGPVAAPRSARAPMNAPAAPTVVPQEHAAPKVRYSGVSAGMSSCDTWFAVLFAPAGYTMAVDIERNSTTRDMDAIAGLALSAPERGVLRRLRPYPEAQRAWFYRIWTTKEAVLKLGSADIFSQAQAVGFSENLRTTRATHGGARLHRGRPPAGHAGRPLPWRGGRPPAGRGGPRRPATDRAKRATDERTSRAQRSSSYGEREVPEEPERRPVRTVTVRLAPAITLTLACPTRFPAMRVMTGGTRSG